MRNEWRAQMIATDSLILGRWDVSLAQATGVARFVGGTNRRPHRNNTRA